MVVGALGAWTAAGCALLPVPCTVYTNDWLSPKNALPTERLGGEAAEVAPPASRTTSDAARTAGAEPGTKRENDWPSRFVEKTSRHALRHCGGTAAESSRRSASASSSEGCDSAGSGASAEPSTHQNPSSARSSSVLVCGLLCVLDIAAATARTTPSYVATSVPAGHIF